jgi:DNA-binding transcriptional MerR regulator/methylmalonyl-CoA mutase cobalamin-binding subunit
LRTGVTPHVLRAWERRYGVVAPTRTVGGQRLYSQVDIERLSRLRRLTERGHAIGRLATLELDELVKLEQESGSVVPPGAEPDPTARHSTAKRVRDVAAAAFRATQRLDASELQAVLERAAVTLGVPDFLDGVVAPVLEQIGDGWREHSVSIAQEHLATAVFGRVLGWLLRVYEVTGAAPRIVVATPPTQAHELGALMAAVSAAAEGWAVTYLGPDLPVTDLVSVTTQMNARAVAISVVSVSPHRDVAADLREIRAGLSERVPLFLGGAAAPALRLEREGAGVVLVETLADLRSLLRHIGEAGAG